MGNFSDEQLKRNGFDRVLVKTFAPASGKDASQHRFNPHGMNNVTPRQWLKNSLEIARAMGLFDMPVVEHNKGHEVSYTFYFNSHADRAKFDMAVNGMQYRKGGFTVAYSPGPYEPEPAAKIDAYVTAVKAFCDRYDIECGFEEVNDHTVLIRFDTNAGRNAFYLMLEKNGPIHEVARRIWKEGIPTPNYDAYRQTI